MHSVTELTELLANLGQATFTSRTCTQKQIDGTKTLVAVPDFRHPCGGQTFICDNADHYLWPGMEVKIGSDSFVYMRDFRYLSRRGALQNTPDASPVPTEPMEFTKSMRDGVTMIFDREKVLSLWTPEVIQSVQKHLDSGVMIPKSFVTPIKEDTAHSYPIGYASIVWSKLDDLGWRGIRPTGSAGNILPATACRASTIEEVTWFLDHCPLFKTL
jgi:hypothetical protein